MLTVIFTLVFILTHLLGVSSLQHLQRNSLHEWCLNSFASLPNSPLNRAFICGEDLQDFQITTDFKVLGLIHILVVSGGHLVAILSLLRFFSSGKHFRILFPFVLTYSWMAGFQPPVVRATIQIVLCRLNKNLNSNLFATELCLLSGILCLSLESMWTSSLSLQLSWLASLILAFANDFEEDSCDLTRSSLIYLIMPPLLLSLGIPVPFSIAANLIIAPLMSFVLLPLGLFALVYHPATVLSDQTWSLVLAGLRVLSHDLLPPTPAHLSISPSVTWGYLLTINCAASIWKRYQMKKPIAC